MKKIVVYTCITNSYDWLLPPLSSPMNVDYVCYSDSHKLNNGGWEVREVPETLRSLPANLVNRHFKIFPHEFFSDYDWSIYVDGNLRILNDLSDIVDEMSREGDLVGCPGHPERSTILEEVPVCKSLGKFSETDLQLIDGQINKYLADGMPEDQPLTENNFIVRKHSDPRVQELMGLWWEHIERYTKRDQISFPYVVWRSGVPVKRFDFAGSIDNQYIKKISHRKTGSKLSSLVGYIRAREVDGMLWRLANFNLDILVSVVKNRNRRIG